MLLGVAWCCMVLHGVAWCCMVLHGVAWCCMVLHGVAWCCMVLHGVAWCCMVLHCVAWCCTLLLGVAVRAGGGVVPGGAEGLEEQTEGDQVLKHPTKKQTRQTTRQNCRLPGETSWVIVEYCYYHSQSLLFSICPIIL